MNPSWTRGLRRLGLLALLVGAAGCASLNVELEGGPTTFDDALAHFFLRGDETDVADGTYRTLREWTRTLDSLPASVSLAVPNEPSTLIDESIRPHPSNASYQMTIYIDVNQDGQLCAGEWRGWSEGWDGGLPNSTVVTMVEVEDEDDCRPTDLSDLRGIEID